MENETRRITDHFGNELNIGDTICFTLTMRINQQPIVRATIKDICFAKKAGEDGTFADYIIPEYIESHAVSWARREKKLIGKVIAHRVVKCY